MLPVHRTLLFAAIAAAGLWLASGFAHVALGSAPYVSRALTLIAPSPTKAAFWIWPMPWSLLALATAAIVIGVIVVGVTVLGTRQDRAHPRFITVWFAVIVAGSLVGLAIDALTTVTGFPTLGIDALKLLNIEFGIIGAYWGLVQGWVPAIIASRSRGASRVDASDSPAPSMKSRTVPVVLASASALVLLVVVGAVGYAADQRALNEEVAAQQETQWTGPGSPPDPAVEGEPVPTTAPVAVERDPAWCTPEQSMLLSGMQDAATGHRVLSIRLMNFSEEPCLTEGYLDVAFADQNNHALDVSVVPGSSFMATDPGPQPIEVPPGGYAIAYLGWDANSTASGLVTATVFAAHVPGDTRGSWPMALDIVGGSTVEVTAWQLDAAGPSGDVTG